ncbi:DUF4426 domain-containing protein [Glaciecola sp.]|jgi:hypothetical protein|nr:DUF4426 domain-containing protein [Glaciecola sp.]
MYFRLLLATLTITLSLVFGISFSAQAEQKVTLGKWDVHYIVFDTTFLTPEIAKANGIVRSKYNALVNISVLETATQVAQRVDISGTARNLIGTTKELKFKRVIDGDAIYYLAPLSFRHGENYTFDITLRQVTEEQMLTFKHEMFVD